MDELKPANGADRYAYAITPHPAASFDPGAMEEAAGVRSQPLHRRAFKQRGTGDEAKAAGLAAAFCPFAKTSFPVSDGRNAEIANSAFGTVYGVVDGKPLAVCDHAGFAPFGFGYRRCPGEQLTIAVFGEFLGKVWADKIEFRTARYTEPRKAPAWLATVIDDAIGFTRRG